MRSLQILTPGTQIMKTNQIAFTMLILCTCDAQSILQRRAHPAGIIRLRRRVDLILRIVEAIAH